MTHPLIRQGEGHNAYHRIHQEQQAQRQRFLKLVDQIIQAPDLTSIHITHGTAAGDEQKLRGVPVHARGVAGAIPGTRPDRIQ